MLQDLSQTQRKQKSCTKVIFLPRILHPAKESKKDTSGTNILKHCSSYVLSWEMIGESGFPPKAFLSPAWNSSSPVPDHCGNVPGIHPRPKEDLAMSEHPVPSPSTNSVPIKLRAQEESVKSSSARYTF